MFVAINFISCNDDYKPRFEQLFATRAHAIDKMEGFKSMNVLRPMDNKSEYLIVSYWESEDNFKSWTKSQEFIEGHQRGFEDIKIARAEGREVPMKSDFKTYKVISD